MATRYWQGTGATAANASVAGNWGTTTTGGTVTTGGPNTGGALSNPDGAYGNNSNSNNSNDTSNANSPGNPDNNSGGDGECFLAGTLITMADETKKSIEEIDLMEKVAVGGYVGGVGKFLTDELYDYNGVKVSGNHLVNENNKWMYVKDSKNSKSLGDDTHVVYVLGTEHRRLLIENILFTDYLETKEQKMFIAKGSDYFFNSHAKIGNEIAKENLDTLNAKT